MNKYIYLLSMIWFIATSQIYSQGYEEDAYQYHNKPIYTLDGNLRDANHLSFMTFDNKMLNVLGGKFTLSHTGAEVQAILDGTIPGDLTMIDDAWIGLGSAKGRIVFSDQATDEVTITDAFLSIETGGNYQLLMGDVGGNQWKIGRSSANGKLYFTGTGGASDYVFDDGDLLIGGGTSNNKFNVDGAFNFASDTSTAPQPDIYDLVISGLVSYTTIVAGTQVSWIAATANTGACNILVNALAQKDLFKMHNQELAANDIEVGQVVTAIYDGTQWQMTSQLAQ